MTATRTSATRSTAPLRPSPSRDGQLTRGSFRIALLDDVVEAHRHLVYPVVDLDGPVGLVSFLLRRR